MSFGMPQGPLDPRVTAERQNESIEAIQAVIQAISQGQDLNSFDPKAISAAKHQVTNRANELSNMINSTSLPPNVTREMLRNELDMYQGFADKLAEDDPEFAGLMDAAFIGAGIYVGAKYGPMAAAKAKTGAQAAYGFVKTKVGGVPSYAAPAVDAVKGAYGAAAGYASPYFQQAGQYARSGLGSVADYASRGASYVTSPEFSQSMGDMRQRVGNYGQRTFGYGKQVMGAAGKAIRRALKLPF
tara:strand:+ start:311 stop:1039 length:729 start_codon:yes stop_codon:yes gene_type:complete